MTNKQICIYGLVYLVMQALINTGIFVTFNDMVAYAAPKDSITKIEAHLLRIEEKIDTLIMKKF